MGQVLHGSARTTAAIRRAIQLSQESLLTLATRHGINRAANRPKTVARWRKRPSVENAPMGPNPASNVLTPQQEACAVAFRRHALLPLSDCLYALQATIPQLTRSSLHRCFQRHGISRLPVNEPTDQPLRKKFKDYPIGYLHIDFAEVHTQEGKQYLFVAVDRTSKVAFAELQPQATKTLAADFLRRVLSKLPYQVHKILTDNGIQFGNMPHQPHALRPRGGPHIFGRVCDQHGVEHRFTKPAHPWANGQPGRRSGRAHEPHA